MKLEREKCCGELLRSEVHNLSKKEIQFLKMAKNPAIRPSLLARLQELELLSAFLEAENGTIQ